MTKEEIEDKLLCLSEEEDDYNKVVKAYNLGLQVVLKEAIVDLYIKGIYRGAKWKKLKEGDEYNPLEKSVSAKLDKKSIKKWKIIV